MGSGSVSSPFSGGHAPRVPLYGEWLPESGLRVFHFQGKAHPDSEAVWPAVAVFESSSEAFRAVLDDGEPEAGSAWVGCGGMPAVEGFAQRRQIFCRDADTRVNH